MHLYINVTYYVIWSKDCYTLVASMWFGAFITIHIKI